MRLNQRRALLKDQRISGVNDRDGSRFVDVCRCFVSVGWRLNQAPIARNPHQASRPRRVVIIPQQQPLVTGAGVINLLENALLENSSCDRLIRFG
jgi:hypothetical protein